MTQAQADQKKQGHFSPCYRFSMPEYDFFRTVREELNQLQKELAAPGVRDLITTIAARLGVSNEETLAVFGTELQSQFEREAARAAQ